MRLALISDIHANRQAVDALKIDLKRARVDSVVCLGDIVGYGPEPQYVLDAVRELTSNVVMGNHDAVAGGRLDSSLFNDNARRIIEWTVSQLDGESAAFFSQVPEMIASDDLLFVHAESAEPMRFSYLMEPDDTFESFQKRPERMTFIGHTHHPGVFEYVPERGVVNRRAPENFKPLTDNRYIINVGSVGEPRGMEILGSYGIYDLEANRMEFRTIPIDVDAYVQDLAKRRLDIEPHFLKVHRYNQELVAHNSHEKRPKPVPILPQDFRTMPRQPLVPATGSPVVQTGLRSPAHVGEKTAAAPPSVRKANKLALFILLFTMAGLAYAAWRVMDYVNTLNARPSATEIEDSL